MRKIHFLMLICLISCGGANSPKNDYNVPSKKEKDTENMESSMDYLDTIKEKSHLLLLKDANMNFLFCSNNTVLDVDKNLNWSLKVNSKSFELSDGVKLLVSEFQSVFYQLDHILKIKLIEGNYEWKNGHFYFNTSKQDFKIQDYGWVVSDTNVFVSFKSDTLIVDEKHLTYGRNFFTIYKINYISNKKLKFLEGTYVALDEEKLKSPDNKDVILTNVTIENNYRNKFQSGFHNYYGFIISPS